MDKTRILPPQVRGKVTGVLDFFVDEIKLFRNILLLTNSFDLVLQVQWWGEVLPVYIRPKGVQVQGRSNATSHLLKTQYHSAKYEVKTTLDLFKSYLRNCEVLELSVLEAFENYVIGSAFLKDLIKLLSNNNKLIRMPIFDYLGEEIGEVIIHVNFLQKFREESKEKLYKNADPLRSTATGEKSEKVDHGVSSTIRSDFFTLGEKTIIYDGHSKKKFQVEEFVESKSSQDHLNFNKKEKITNISLTVSETDKNLLKEQENNFNKKSECESRESTCSCLPEVKALSDPSKVLYFGLNSKQSKTDAGKSNLKIANKYNSNSIKCKSKCQEKRLDCKKLIVKKPVNCTNGTKNSTVVRKEKQNGCKVSSETFKSEAQPLHEPEVPSNTKVLNYLLGSDMSKSDEEAALNDFRKMSPSQNLVDSINELCLVSGNNSPKSVVRYNSPASVKETNLKFDFSNPIERSYYERFFSKKASPCDFEIAELLNKPSKGFPLDKYSESSKCEPHVKNVRKFSNVEGGVSEKREKEISVNERRNNCARCKYYKKLDELDTIIESLKNFEQKMLFHDNDLQYVVKLNSDMT